MTYHSFKMCSNYEIMEKIDHITLLNDLEMHFIELPKLTNYDIHTVKELDTLEKWIIFFKDAADENKRELIEELRSEEAIDMAVKVLDKISQDEKMRILYQQRKTELIDRRSSAGYLLEKGKREGKRENSLEVATNLITLGVDLKIIQHATGLSENEIMKIKRTLS